MRTFAEWAAHYGYEDTPQARQDYQRYVDQLDLFASTDNTGFIGISVVIRNLNDGFVITFPPVLIGELALELAEMLDGVYPDTEVLVIHHAYDRSQRPKADQDTEKMERRVIAARESDEPGKSFLQGLGYTFPEKE